MRRTRAQTQQRRDAMARTRRQQLKEEETAEHGEGARHVPAEPTARELSNRRPPPQATKTPPTATAEDADGNESESSADEEEEETASGADGMTEYERKRLENIQRNLDFMRSMGVSTAKIAARTAASVPAHLQKGVLGSQRGISTTKRKPSDKPVVPMRKSRRLEGKQADAIAMRDDLHALSTEEIKRESERVYQPARFGAHLDAEPLNVDGAQGQQFLSSIVGEYEEREEDLRVDASGVDVMGYSLRESDVVKAVEERVYSLAFHPRSDRVVVACGDKRGNVALWQADAPVNSDDNVVAMYRPHTLPTTQLHFQPTDATKLLSASFDGTVRQFDLKAAKFTELFATEDHTGITSLAITTKRDTLLASGDDGHVWSIDIRQAPAKHAAYLTHEKKVQTVHQHPLIDFCFATASLDRTVCLWDVRKLSKSSIAKPLVTMPHHRSVNCAYFSPTGHHLVTVGQDDYIHVYNTQDATHLNTDDVKPTLRIPHNNQTGRWLTKLHAAWDPKRPDEYVIGCMQQPRRIQIFKATRKSPIQELQSEYFASVHSINVFHPTLHLIAGGNSSGRLCLFRGDTKEKRELKEE